MASDLGSEGQRERRVAGEVRLGSMLSEGTSAPQMDTARPLQAQQCRAPHSGKGELGRGLSLPAWLRASHFHCVHLGGAPALDFTGPQLRAVIHTAAGEEPCEGEDTVLGARLPFATLSPASPVLTRDLPPKHTHGLQMEGKDRESKGGPSVAH